MKTMRSVIRKFWIMFLPLSVFAQTPRTYLLQEADDYFKAGRYWDAFFRYRECAKLPEFQSENQISEQVKNSSHALYLTQKFKDYSALRRYEPAKTNLVELISMNPNDPHKGELPRLTLAQGAELQRLAWRQATAKGTADMLKRAILYYHQAIREGLMDESITTTIKQCEASIKETKVPDADDIPVLVTQPTQENTTIVSPASVPVASPRKPANVVIIPTTKEN